MADDFGLKIGLDGEKEFKKALSDINQSFKVLGSEMKVVQSQFDKNDNSVEALTARNQVLNKEIEAQKQKIETLRSALENASSSFGENDRRTQNWQIQLNNATAALNDMERELEKNNDALDKAGDELDDAEQQADQFGDEIEDAGKQSDDAKGKFEGLGTACKAVGATITAAFAAVSAAAISAGKALVDMAVEGAAYADDVLTTSTQTGIATDKLQEYMYAAELVDVSTETLTKSMAKQIKSMKGVQDGTKLSVEAYDRLGVSVLDANGNLRDSDTVYWEVIDALGKMENETERDALAMQILGKSAQELNPLIEAGAERMNALGAEAREAGYVVSDEMLNAYGALDDQLQYLDVGATAAKNALGTVLLPVLTDLAGEGVDLLGEFSRGIIAADGDIGKMSEVIASVLPKALNAIMEYVPEMLEIIGSIVGSLGQAIVDNLPALVDSASQIIFAILTGLIEALPQITDGALQLILALVEGLIANLPMIIEAALQMVVTLATGIADALPELIPSIVQVIVQICQTLIENLPQLLEAALQLIIGLAEGIIKAIPVLIQALPELIQSIIAFLIGSIPQIIEAGIELFVALIANLPTIIVEIVKAIPQIIAGIVQGFAQGVGKLAEVGGNLVRGLWQGIQSLASWLWNKVSGWISSIWDGICDFFGIHSPSDEMAWVGEMLVEGLSGALDTSGKKAVKSAEHMAEDINGVMHGLADDIHKEIPTDFDFSANVGYTADKATLAGIGSGLSGIFNLNQPIMIDGKTITTIVSQIQYSQGRATIRNLGTA